MHNGNRVVYKTMIEIFLNTIRVISDSRYWLGPLLAICVYVVVAWEIIITVQDEIEEPIFHHRPRPWR